MEVATTTTITAVVTVVVVETITIAITRDRRTNLIVMEDVNIQ